MHRFSSALSCCPLAGSISHCSPIPYVEGNVHGFRPFRHAGPCRIRFGAPGGGAQAAAAFHPSVLARGMSMRPCSRRITVGISNRAASHTDHFPSTCSHFSISNFLQLQLYCNLTRAAPHDSLTAQGVPTTRTSDAASVIHWFSRISIASFTILSHSQSIS